MKCPKGGKIAAIVMISVSLLILTSFVLCNPSYAEYKKRVLASEVTIKINYSEDPLQIETVEEPQEEQQEEMLPEVVEEGN